MTHIHIHLPAKTVDRKVRDAEYKGWSLKEFQPGKWMAHKGTGNFGPATSEQELKSRLDKYLASVAAGGGAPQGSKDDADCKAKDSSFPSSITFKGEKYSKTGKTGKNFASGEETAEYRLESYGAGKTKIDKRVWQTASGKITQDAKAKDATASADSGAPPTRSVTSR
jgi:hypothetical protein